jgi:uncharacterized membrane-anchored protein
MYKSAVVLLFIIAIPFKGLSQELDSTQFQIALIEQSLKYETGTIELENATLVVPDGFRYLDKKQSIFVLSDLWGNPVDSAVLGLLVPESRGVLAPNSWVFSINYEELGYIEDDDADDIDYDDLLEEQQTETREGNAQRVELGYPAIELVGWASSPFYDKDKKVLHWAKELKFGEDSLHTLNYNLRVLGRKGVYVMNAIASMNEMPEVKSSIDKVTSSVAFNDGSKYADFNPEIDEVAAWTVGGLVAGKVLAKAGFFAIVLKFWKIIALAVAGVGGAVWKYFTGKKESA